MTYTFKVEKFEGPLYLLLRLIEKEELPITEVSLAEVTDQYIEYIQHRPVPAEELADFLVVASKLLHIKSKIILPTIDLGIDEDGIPLEEQLRIYKEFLDVSKQLEARILEKRFSYTREKAPIQQGIFAPPSSGLKSKRLTEAFKDVLAALEPVLRLPQTAIARIVSIEERIGDLRELIAKKASISFGLFLRSAKSRTDVIVSFLALLELIKQKTISVHQDGMFDDMTINRYESAKQH